MYYDSFTHLRNQLQEPGWDDITVICSDGRTRCSRLLLALTTELPFTCLQDSEVDLLFLEDIKVDEFHLAINLLTGSTIYVKPIIRDRIGELLDRFGFRHDLDVSELSPPVEQVCFFPPLRKFKRLCNNQKSGYC